MLELREYLGTEGWELLDPIDRDHGVLYRAQQGRSIVQAATVAELCRRIADIERGVVKPYQPTDN